VIDLEHIPELIDELNAGSLSIEDVYVICIEAMEKFHVESVLASLPPHLLPGGPAEGQRGRLDDGHQRAAG
jgi:hypothetical protein